MDLINKNSYKICAFLVLISGIFAMSPKNLSRLLVGVNINFIAHPVSTFLGFTLLYISFQLFRRKRLAYLISFSAMSILFFIAVLRGHFWQSSVYLIVLTVLTLTKSHFKVKSNNLNLKRAMSMSGVVLLLAFSYGIVSLYLIDKKMFNHDFTLLESVKYSVIQLMSFDSGLLHPATHQAELFLRSLDVIGLSTLFIVIVNLFKPIKFELFVSSKDYLLANELVAQYSTSTEDYFLLWPQDKHYYFNRSKSSFLAYRVQNGVALVLGGPIGKSTTFKRLLENFKLMCNSNGWIVSIIHSDDTTMKLAERMGMNSVFIGNEAIVDIKSFCEITLKDKHFRYVDNKAKAENLSIDFWQPPHSKNDLQRLKKVSDSWLKTPSRREYGFIMGPFSTAYLNKCRIMILKQNGKIIAYTNVIPNYVSDSASIDHMRHLPGIPNISMHFLLKSLIGQLADLDFKWFNLGLSPLAGLKDIKDPDLSERVLSIIKILGARYYSFKGVEQFKNKFRPIWQPKYILYEGRSPGLFKITRALSKASAISKPKSSRKIILYVLGIIASVSFVNFTLSYPLGLSSIGYVSRLEQRGTAYNWLFIIADIIAGTIICYLAYLGVKHSKKPILKLKYSLFALGGVGNIIAVLAPIRSSADYLHSIFSAISILGFFGAIFMDALSLKNKNQRNLVLILVVGLFCVGGLSAVSSITASGFIQRLQLFFITFYIVVFAHKIIKKL